MANEDLASMTPDQLRLEISRNSRKNTKRAMAALDLWMAKTGHTIESLAALVSERLHAAAR